ncbi:multiple cyclophane-containing RiPP AmcA [Micromonospora sp. NPDC050417]|uniref:multiple cyclophane-containing RiPP AmcA n=1 Tax=Micromonospora sp. NPDC050417 TaxID=3364280 RepID=UPI003797CEE4
MPEMTSVRSVEPAGPGEPVGSAALEAVTDRVRAARSGLTRLLQEAEEARRERAEVADAGGGAVCAWNHFENIPTFYNWNNRPR